MLLVLVFQTKNKANHCMTLCTNKLNCKGENTKLFCWQVVNFTCTCNIQGGIKTVLIGQLFTTLKTNISPLKRATVLKFPSQMLGLLPGEEGLSPKGGLGGLECLSCFLSDVE